MFQRNDFKSIATLNSMSICVRVKLSQIKEILIRKLFLKNSSLKTLSISNHEAASIHRKKRFPNNVNFHDFPTTIVVDYLKCMFCFTPYSMFWNRLGNLY